MTRRQPSSRSCPPAHRATRVSLRCLAGLLLGVIACGPSNDPAATTNPATSSSGPDTSINVATSTPTSTSSATESCVTDCRPPSSSSSTTCDDFLTCDDTLTGGVPPGCDVWAQDCPEGQKCAAIISDSSLVFNSVACVPVNGSGEAGDACISKSIAEGLDDCAEGVMCWDVDDMGNGTCIKLCEGTPDTPICPNDGGCLIANDGVLNLCLPICSPLLQDCAGDDACYPIDGSFACLYSPNGPDVGAANDPCEFHFVCDPGLMCADAAFVGAGCPQGSTSCCTPFCDLSDPAATCPNPDQSCVPYFDPVDLPIEPPDAKDIGVCGLPG